MEQSNYGRRKSRIPAFIRSAYTRHLTQGASNRSRSMHGPDCRNFDRDSAASKKTVTMAPTSRYMTGRSLYTARKPLISTEHHTSILKNPLTHEYSKRVYMSNFQANCQMQDERLDSNMLDSTSVPKVITSSLSASREDLCASLNLSDLRLCSSHEEPIYSPGPSASKVENRSLSSSPLDDLNLTIPISPMWTSTQRILPLSYTAQARTFQRSNTRASKQEKNYLLNTDFSLRNKSYLSAPKQMSQYQSTYWDCAIPSTLPPSPDRKSPSWDPDKEYQTLLDYTYPLRPNMTYNWSSNEHKLQTDQPLQDSGIEVDSFLSSSSLSFLDKPVSGMRQGRSGPASRQPFGFQCPNLMKLAQSKPSDIRVSRSLNSLEQVGLSLESLDCEGKCNSHYKKFSTSRSTPTFIRSTSILPSLRSLGEWDEEFLQLPEQLHEIQDLSQKLKDITAQINQPVTTNQEVLEQQSVSIRSLMQAGKKADEDSYLQQSAKKVPLIEQKKRLNTRVQLTRDNLGDMEATVDQLREMTLYEFKRKTEIDEGVERTQESLLQNLQSFCSNLEKLIQWLHKVVERMDMLSPPSGNIDSVKASLADYKSFQEEVQAHKPLTTSVLQTGECLLSCINSTSPFLKDTLTLIERQSHALESHSEHLFSSILSTMDCLTDPNLWNNTGATA
ncbi:centrosomal protein of 68 kDa isoform X1 [Silurus meridionalis]|nr:centrosomal protein of 68 kDa isoform X1 [Silurus meridionalis]